MADHRNEANTKMQTHQEYKYGSTKVYEHLKTRQAKDNISFSCCTILKPVFSKMHLVENVIPCSALFCKYMYVFLCKFSFWTRNMTQKFDMWINNSALIGGSPLALDYTELIEKWLVNNNWQTPTQHSLEVGQKYQDGLACLAEAQLVKDWERADELCPQRRRVCWRRRRTRLSDRGCCCRLVGWGCHR